MGSHYILRLPLLAAVVLAYFAHGAPATAAPTRSPTASTLSGSTLLYVPLVTQSPGTGRLLWGALVNGLPPAPEALQAGGAFDTFETRAGKGLAILHWGQSWQVGGSYKKFYTPYFENARQHGSLSLFNWSPWLSGGGPNQPNFRLSAIYGGAHDDFIRQWAADAQAWGHPFFLRFAPEMNGNWRFPWMEQLNGNQPGDYVKAWRHVHDIFTEAGATNATWVWCPNVSSPTLQPLAELYPGDDYVDWTCLDGYNKYDTWLSFNSVFTGSGIHWLSDSYQEVLAVAPSKPILLGEVGSLEAGDGGAAKAAWIIDALSTQIPLNFPSIKGVVWFNWDDNSADYASLAIESSPAAQAAFAQAIGSNRYAGNEFTDYAISPIQPLP